MNKEKKIPGHILSLFIILLSISGVCLLMYKAQFRFNLHQPIEYVMMTTHKPTGTITLSSDSPVLTETFTCTVPELKMFTLEGTAKNKTSNARLFITLTNADSGEIYYQAEHTLSVFRATKKKELTCDLWGRKPKQAYRRYVLSSRRLGNEVLKSFGLQMKPAETLAFTGLSAIRFNVNKSIYIRFWPFCQGFFCLSDSLFTNFINIGP